MHKRIMVVEDNAFARMMIKEVIESHGYRVVGEASGGLEAIEMYSKLKPDVVTMDITMPDINGIEVVKAIIASDQEAKIIMISALGQPEPIVGALKAGAKDFLAKPFKKDRVKQAINQVTGQVETAKK